MAYNAIGGFPRQQLSYSRKNKKWRIECVKFGDDHSLLHYHQARKSVVQMKIDYDLLNGKIHMNDLKAFLNPDNLDASYIPDNIQHYSVLDRKLRVLRGEETERLFDYRVVVTNPSGITEIEEEKNRRINEKIEEMVQNESQSEEDFDREIEKVAYYFRYSYQDKREQRANMLLNHYVKELRLDQLFNKGFVDAYTVGEEAYQVDIVGGEPVVWKIDPMKMRVIKSGGSDKIEDADMIILEDYWSPGKVIDVFYDQLSKEDVKKLDEAPDNMGRNYTDEMDNVDERYGFLPITDGSWEAGDVALDPNVLFDDEFDTELLPFDMNGNVRVLRVYWKSRRKIKKVKSYDEETGEEKYDFYPEDYVTDKDRGEEEEVFWINEAWEGTKIGQDIYVNMRPRPIQYNRMSNPSRCHFGIIGSIYNINGREPYSMVDVAKPYCYAYDVYSDRLNKLIAKNIGKVVRMDFAKVPDGWEVDKWLYYLKVNSIAVEDSAKEINYGPATGKVAAQLNNNSSGVIDASLGSEIQQYIQLLTWIDQQIGAIIGISPQREGQISNRETVGGVERATLQSSHITKELFFVHDDVKRRVMECVLETAKICMRGRKKKFSYITNDGAEKMMEIDGDEFAENDYGLIVENSNSVQELNQRMDTLAQAALQNGQLNFSTMMKLYTTTSIAEKQRRVEEYENRTQEMQQQQQQQETEMKRQQLQQEAMIAERKARMEEQQHREDNETKILVARINGQAEADRMNLAYGDLGSENEINNRKLDESIRQFDEKMKQEADKLKLEQQKHRDDVRIKEQQIAASRARQGAAAGSKAGKARS